MSLREYYYNTLEKNPLYVNDSKYQFNPNTINITDSWDKQGISYKNRLIANPITIGGGGIGGGEGVPGNATGWWDAVQKMGAWYQQNVHTYQGTREKPRSGRQWYDCPLINRKVQDDCSAFVWACLQFFKPDVFKEKSWSPTCLQFTKEHGKSFSEITQLEQAGFKWIKWSRDALQPGDIMVGCSIQGCTHCGHTEVYAGNKKSYSWGSVHDGQGGKQGMPCSSSFSKGRGSSAEPYYDIWRQ